MNVTPLVIEALGLLHKDRVDAVGKALEDSPHTHGFTSSAGMYDAVEIFANSLLFLIQRGREAMDLLDDAKDELIGPVEVTTDDELEET